jgi:hypothetical protein
VRVLDYRTAQQKALEQIAEWEPAGKEPPEPLTIRAAVDAYVADLRARKGDRAADEAQGRMRKHLLPVLGDVELGELTASEFLNWRNGLVGGEGRGGDSPQPRHRQQAPREREGGLQPGVSGGAGYR